MYVYTYIHICVYIYAYIYAYVCTRTDWLTHLRPNTLTHSPTHPHTVSHSLLLFLSRNNRHLAHQTEGEYRERKSDSERTRKGGREGGRKGGVGGGKGGREGGKHSGRERRTHRQTYTRTHTHTYTHQSSAQQGCHGRYRRTCHLSTPPGSRPPVPCQSS